MTDKKEEFTDKFDEVAAIWDIKKSKAGAEYIGFTATKIAIPVGSQLVAFENKLYQERKGNPSFDQEKLPPRFRVFIDKKAGD